jgi:hypothetical protein
MMSVTHSIGPVDLTVGTVDKTAGVSTVVDNLFTQGTIPINAVSVSYTPTTTVGAANGEVTFGATDSSKYAFLLHCFLHLLMDKMVLSLRFTGEIGYVPITSTAPASRYWGIDQTLTYGGGNSGTQLLSSSGIVDTGTTLLLIATDAFQAYQRATGAVLDPATGLLTITEDQHAKLQSMFFKIGDVSETPASSCQF